MSTDLTDSFDELRTVVQELRAETYPDLPAELVDEILNAERRHEEERDKALREVRRALDEAAATERGPEET